MGQWDERSGTGAKGSNPGGAAGNGHATIGDGPTGEIDDRREQLEAAIERARIEMERYTNVASDFIRERPVASIVGALAVGWLIGKLASRR